MKRLQPMLLALAGLFVSTLLLTNVAYIAAFKPSEEPSRPPTATPAPSSSGSAVSSPATPQPQQPSFSSPISPPLQQQQQPIIPGIVPAPSQEQEQPEPIVPGGAQEQQQEPEEVTPLGPVEGFRAIGTVNSLITTPSVKWIATGNWSMFVGNGKMISFITNMSWYNNNGTGAHTHEFLKFVPTGGNLTLGSDNSLHLNGLMDVGTDHRVVWKNVHSIIDIKRGKTISISVDDNETNDHFAGQPILGVATSVTRCSDEPGPDMEVLPPCTSS